MAAPNAEPIALQPLATHQAELTLPQAGSIFPVLGKAMLGIAGAYLLRAVAESGSFPKLAVAAIAIAYAGLWLARAARLPASSAFAAATYAITAELILAPMLWELTLKFNVLPASAAAVVLAVFVVGAAALMWNRERPLVFWVANVTSAATALVLLVATRDPAPFAAALLAMAVVSEYAACRRRRLGARLLVALAADIAIWAVVQVYGEPVNLRADYRSLSTAWPLAFACSLLLIYGVSVDVQAVWQKQKLTLLEIGQAMIAFALAAWSIFCIAPNSGVIAFGIVCMALAVAGYAIAFTRFADAEQQRNFHIFATWAAVLLLMGCMILTAGTGFVACLCLTALVLMISASRFSGMTLKLQAILFLVVAAAQSGLAQFVFWNFAGRSPAAPGLQVWIVFTCAIALFVLGGDANAKGWTWRVPAVVTAAAAIGVIAAGLVFAVASLAARGMEMDAAPLAVVRTLVLCGVALALVYNGARRRRPELGWIGYSAMAFIVLKLLLEDLRLGHLGFTAASIFLFAATLMLLPRLSNRASR
jgi:hypothetical protein